MGRRSVAGMLKLARSIVSVLALRVRSRAVLELKNLALRRELHVLCRERPGRPHLIAIDHLLWVWLYRIWPRCLNAMVGQAGHRRPIAHARYLNYRRSWSSREARS
jgi:hypothetical protein